jgi:hypothetical protein
VTSDWFPGKAWDAESEEFLTGLRARAGTQGLVDATPDDTTLHAWGSTLVVLVAAPGLQDHPAKPTLEVVCELSRGTDLVCGWETFGYLTDDYDPMDMAGADLTPKGLGFHAFDWFEAELRRPLERATWRTWRGERSVVRYADTEVPVWGHVPKRLRNRPPDSTERVR